MKPGMRCALLGWAPTPQARRVPWKPQEPKLEPEEVLSCFRAFACGSLCWVALHNSCYFSVWHHFL